MRSFSMTASSSCSRASARGGPSPLADDGISLLVRRDGAADESLPDALPALCSVRSRPPFGGRISGAGDAFGSTGGT